MKKKRYVCSFFQTAIVKNVSRVLIGLLTTLVYVVNLRNFCSIILSLVMLNYCC